MKKKIILLPLTLLVICSCSNNGSVTSNNASNTTPSSIGSNTTSTGTSTSTSITPVSIPSPSTDPDENYDSTKSTIIALEDNASTVTNNNGFVVISENEIYITGAGTYDVSGTLSNGKIIVNPASEDEKIELNLNGVNITCNYGAPIGIFNGDKIDISAKKNTKNYINDTRTSDIDTKDGSNAALYSTIDMKIKGAGYLSVTSSYNNGIATKDDLEIQKAEIEVTAPNNAIKGSDSLTINSGTITAISTNGDALKTSNSDISSKGKQRGTITILDGKIKAYAACDAIDAAYDVIIGDATNKTYPTIEAYTESYSPYSKEVTATSSEKMYFALSFSRGGYFDTDSTVFCALFTFVDNTQSWVTLSKETSSGNFNRSTYYYSLKKPSNAQSVTFYGYSNSQTINSTETYTYISEANMSLPTNNDMFKVSSINGNTMKGSWTNYQNQPGGPGGGGMQEGNPNSADYSCKGVKADNQITIEGGAIVVKAHDDAIHANNDNLLETNVYGEGSVTINGGTFDLYTDDDGIHADSTLTINNGTINISNSYEGLEAFTININGGTMVINSSDDGVNAAGGDERENAEMLNITSGLMYISAQGDVIDSNGNIEMSGGVVFAQGPSRGGNGLLDFDGTFTFKGGFFFGFGGADMRQAPTKQGDVTVKAQTNYSVTSNKYITVTDGTNVIASMRVTMSNLSYYVLAYDNTYPSSLTVTNSSSSDVTLVDDLYYIYK